MISSPQTAYAKYIQGLSDEMLLSDIKEIQHRFTLAAQGELSPGPKFDYDFKIMTQDLIPEAKRRQLTPPGISDRLLT